MLRSLLFVQWIGLAPGRRTDVRADRQGTSTCQQTTGWNLSEHWPDRMELGSDLRRAHAALTQVYHGRATGIYEDFVAAPSIQVGV